MQSNNSFNGAINYSAPEYKVECEHCHGNGHTHCKECGDELRCEKCGGSGKKNIYEGNVFKIYWNI